MKLHRDGIQNVTEDINIEIDSEKLDSIESIHAKVGKLKIFSGIFIFLGFSLGLGSAISKDFSLSFISIAGCFRCFSNVLSLQSEIKDLNYQVLEIEKFQRTLVKKD